MFVTFVEIFTKIIIFLSLIQYSIGWGITTNLIHLDNTSMLTNLFVVSGVVFLVCQVSRMVLKNTFSVQIFLLLLILVFIGVLSFANRWGVIVTFTGRLDGFTKKEGFEWVVQPGIRPDHEKTNYLFCILGGSKTCSNIKVNNFLIYKPYQVCNIAGSMLYKSIEKISTYDILNRSYIIFQRPNIKCRDSFVTKFFDLRDRVISEIKNKIHQPQSSLLVGIIFGNNLSFDDRFQKAIQAAGINHIVAASGYNVSILILGLDSILKFLPKKILNIFKIIMIWVYAMLTGFSSSMIRASFMTSLAIGSEFFGKSLNGRNVFKLTFCILTILNPFIIFDLGFLLSAGATWGLMYLVEPLQKLIKLDWFPHTTLACTLATLPITVLHFNTISPYSLVANAIILPVIEIVMLVGILGLFVKPFLYVAYGSLKFVELVTYSFVNLPFSIIETNQISSLIVFVILMLIIFFVYKINNESKPNINYN